MSPGGRKKTKAFCKGGKKGARCKTSLPTAGKNPDREKRGPFSIRRERWGMRRKKMLFSGPRKEKLTPLKKGGQGKKCTNPPK